MGTVCSKKMRKSRLTDAVLFKGGSVLSEPIFDYARLDDVCHHIFQHNSTIFNTPLFPTSISPQSSFVGAAA